MADKYVNVRNLKFLLFEVLEAHKLNRYHRYKDYDREAFEFALDAARQIADKFLFPYYREMDRKKAGFIDGKVETHPALKEAIQAIAAGGWISAHDDYEEGGQQMPIVLLNAGLFIFYAANANAAAYPFLTQGAANLINNFGSRELRDRYVPLMYGGSWQGTMALTEPQAGSSLSDISTTAEPLPDGSYRIKGQKIYISGGDHSGVDNVVHLLLAKIKGAPAGTRGISLFVVPKKRIANGSLEGNDVTTAGIFGKMGQKGYVAAHLMLGEQGDCRGYLVGKPNAGLRYMFQMMNEARIATGMVAAAMATAAYYASLQYANERPQGRHPSNKNAEEPQIPIIEHADVRRMLLFQKAITEGSASLLLQCSYYADLSEVAEGEEKENAHLLFELLTPVAKSYPSEMGNLSVSAGLQVLGGAGYCDDFPLEQYYRDIRINAIYEGTTGIHGLDLLGRKVMLDNGKPLLLLLQEIKKTTTPSVTSPKLAPFAEKMEAAAKALHGTTRHLMQLAMKERPEVFLADATLYLDFFGIVVIAWQWLLQAIHAEKGLTNASSVEQSFYRGKLAAMQYFFEYELPKTKALQERLLSGNRLTLDTDPESIN